MDTIIGEIITMPLCAIRKIGGCPQGFINCDGKLLAISKFQALYDVIGNKYGGDGENTFSTPNLSQGETSADYCYLMCATGLFPSESMHIDVTTGTVRLFPSHRSISNFERCDGAVVPVTGSESSESGNFIYTQVVGSIFGGDGVTTVGLPALSPLRPITGYSYFVCVLGHYPPPINYDRSEEDALIGEVRPMLPFLSYGAEPFGNDSTALIKCDGRMLSGIRSTALYSLVGNVFGGDENSGAFKLPNLTNVPAAHTAWGICARGTYPVFN